MERFRAWLSQTQDDTNLLDDDTQVKVAPSQVLDKCKRGQKQVGPHAQAIGHGANYHPTAKKRTKK